MATVRYCFFVTGFAEKREKAGQRMTRARLFFMGWVQGRSSQGEARVSPASSKSLADQALTVEETEAG